MNYELHEKTERQRESNRASYYKNREKRLAACAEYRAKNKEKVNAGIAKWREENVERVRQQKAEWKLSNSEKVKADNAAWRASNKDKTRACWHAYRARKLSGGGELSRDIANRLLVSQQGKCACGCKQPLGDDYHLDHIMPLALGGANEDWNIQLLRARCNFRKGAKDPIEFAQENGRLL